jgi:hypothetical protein
MQRIGEFAFEESLPRPLAASVPYSPLVLRWLALSAGASARWLFRPISCRRRRLSRVARWLALVAIAAGTLVVGFNVNRSNLFDLPGGHGVHVTDVIGALLITFGTAVLWVASHPRR